MRAVSVIARIDREQQAVSLAGTKAQHAALHGPDCQLAFTAGRWPRSARTAAQLADLQAHVELAAALKAQGAATRNPVAA